MDERKRLLGAANDDCDLVRVDPEVRGSAAKRRPYWRKQSWLMYLTAVHAFLVFSLMGNLYQICQSSTMVRRLTIFPELRFLNQVVKTDHPEHGRRYSEYAGPPSNATAEAWTTLLQPFYFNASASEIEEAGFDSETSVRIADGGYLASLGVYHELHCLNQLRNFLYLHDPFTETAEPRMTHSQLGEYRGHLDHCIEVLRLSVTCSADLSLYTFTWPVKKDFKFLDAHSHSPRKCVDWDQVEAWSSRRKVSLTPTVVLPATMHRLYHAIEKKNT